MKLFIQIPCLNEEDTLPYVIADLPRKIKGIDEIYTLIIDDGSSDNTIEVAKGLGIDYIVKNNRNLGLAKSFNRGIEACLSLGADIIVNTDGDNQYRGSDIAKLVKPVVEGKSDIVVGCRDIKKQGEFSKVKKILHKMGSYVVRRLSQIDIPDTTSGFRALSQAAAIKFSIMNSFSYTLEMLIQAKRTELKVDWTPIQTNPKTRASRLFKSTRHFVFQQIKVLFLVYLFYYPMRFLSTLASIFLIISILMATRIIYFLWFSDPAQLKFKTGSGILLLFSSIVAVVFFITGLLSSVISGLRFLIVDIRSRVRNMELQQKVVSPEFNIIRTSQFFKWQKTTKTKPPNNMNKYYE